MLRRGALLGSFSLLLIVGCHRAGASTHAESAGKDWLSRPAKVAASDAMSGATRSAMPAGAPPFAAPPLLPAGTLDVATLAARVKPAVVNITITKSQRVAPMGLGPFGGYGGGDRVMRQTALGSGFIIDAEGHIVTNAHVVEGADEVSVKLADEREFSAKVKGRDHRLDLAVLELVGARDLPFVSLGQSEPLRVGEYVVAIGNPFGLGQTVTMGIVSAKGRAIGAGPYDDFIQTDAAINPGNSGGPLFDSRGAVVGINTAINPNGQGIGFAIPADTVREVLPQLLARGRVERGRLGVGVQPIDATLAKAMHLADAHGALIGEIESDGPAAKSGLAVGDVIVSVGGERVQRSEDVPKLVAKHAPGESVSIEVRRDDKSRTFDVKLAALADDPRDASDEAEGAEGREPSKRGRLGVAIAPSTDGEGVVVGQVLAGSPAEHALVPGDRILEVDGHAIRSPRELRERIGAAGPRAIVLRIERQGRQRLVGVDLSR
jgi:serine protease Do